MAFDTEGYLSARLRGEVPTAADITQQQPPAAAALPAPAAPGGATASVTGIPAAPAPANPDLEAFYQERLAEHRKNPAPTPQKEQGFLADAALVGGVGLEAAGRIGKGMVSAAAAGVQDTFGGRYTPEGGEGRDFLDFLSDIGADDEPSPILDEAQARFNLDRDGFLYKMLNETPDSAGASALSAIAGLGTQAVGAAGAALAAPETGGASLAALAGVRAAGTAASLGVMRQTTRGLMMRDLITAMDSEMVQTEGRHMSPQEIESAYTQFGQQMSAVANDEVIGEIAPTIIENMLLPGLTGIARLNPAAAAARVTAINAAKGRLARVGSATVKKFGNTAKLVAGTTATEIPGEAWTSVAQEADLMGTPLETPEGQRYSEMGPVERYVQAGKDVTPAVVGTQLLIGGGSKATSAIRQWRAGRKEAAAAAALRGQAPPAAPAAEVLPAEGAAQIEGTAPEDQIIDLTEPAPAEPVAPWKQQSRDALVADLEARKGNAAAAAAAGGRTFDATELDAQIAAAREGQNDAYSFGKMIETGFDTDAPVTPEGKKDWNRPVKAPELQAIIDRAAAIDPDLGKAVQGFFADEKTGNLRGKNGHVAVVNNFLDSLGGTNADTTQGGEQAGVRPASDQAAPQGGQAPEAGGSDSVQPVREQGQEVVPPTAPATPAPVVPEAAAGAAPTVEPPGPGLTVYGSDKKLVRGTSKSAAIKAAAAATGLPTSEFEAVKDAKKGDYYVKRKAAKKAATAPAEPAAPTGEPAAPTGEPAAPTGEPAAPAAPAAETAAPAAAAPAAPTQALLNLAAKVKDGKKLNKQDTAMYNANKEQIDGMVALARATETPAPAAPAAEPAAVEPAAPAAAPATETTTETKPKKKGKGKKGAATTEGKTKPAPVGWTESRGKWLDAKTPDEIEAWHSEIENAGENTELGKQFDKLSSAVNEGEGSAQYDKYEALGEASEPNLSKEIAMLRALAKKDSSHENLIKLFAAESAYRTLRDEGRLGKSKPAATEGEAAGKETAPATPANNWEKVSSIISKAAGRTIGVVRAKMPDTPGLKELVDFLKKSGITVTFVELTDASTTEIKNGFTIKGNPEFKNTVFINTKAANPHMAVIGHEVAHIIDNDTAGLGPFRKALADVMNLNKFKGRNDWTADELKGDAFNEAVMDAFGDLASSQKFWNQIADKLSNTTSPDVVSRVFNKITNALTTIYINVFDPALKEQAKYHKAVGAVRDAAQDAFTEAVNKGWATKTESVEFSKNELDDYLVPAMQMHDEGWRAGQLIKGKLGESHGDLTYRLDQMYNRENGVTTGMPFTGRTGFVRFGDQNPTLMNYKEAEQYVRKNQPEVAKEMFHPRHKRDELDYFNTADYANAAGLIHSVNFSAAEAWNFMRRLSKKDAKELNILIPAVRGEESGLVTLGRVGETHAVPEEKHGANQEANDFYDYEVLDFGFVTQDGKYLTRTEAMDWLKENEPKAYRAVQRLVQRSGYAHGLESQHYMYGMGVALGFIRLNDLLNNVDFSTGATDESGTRTGGLERGLTTARREAANRVLDSTEYGDAAQFLGRLAVGFWGSRPATTDDEWRDNFNELTGLIKEEVAAIEDPALRAAVHSVVSNMIARSPLSDIIRAFPQWEAQAREQLGYAPSNERLAGIVQRQVDLAARAARAGVAPEATGGTEAGAPQTFGEAAEAERQRQAERAREAQLYDETDFSTSFTEGPSLSEMFAAAMAPEKTRERLMAREERARQQEVDQHRERLRRLKTLGLPDAEYKRRAAESQQSIRTKEQMAANVEAELNRIAEGVDFSTASPLDYPPLKEALDKLVADPSEVNFSTFKDDLHGIAQNVFRGAKAFGDRAAAEAANPQGAFARLKYNIMRWVYNWLPLNLLRESARHLFDNLGITVRPGAAFKAGNPLTVFESLVNALGADRNAIASSMAQVLRPLMNDSALAAAFSGAEEDISAFGGALGISFLKIDPRRNQDGSSRIADYHETSWIPEAASQLPAQQRIQEANKAWKRARMDKLTGVATYQEAYRLAQASYDRMIAKDARLKDIYDQVDRQLKEIRQTEREAWVQKVHDFAELDMKAPLAALRTVLANAGMTPTEVATQIDGLLSPTGVTIGYMNLYRANDTVRNATDAVRKIINDRNTEIEKATKMYQEIKGVYIPLARFGQYVVKLTDSNGDVVDVRRFESAFDQDNFVNAFGEVQAQYATLGVNITGIEAYLDPKHDMNMKDIPRDFTAKFGFNIDEAHKNRMDMASRLLSTGQMTQAEYESYERAANSMRSTMQASLYNTWLSAAPETSAMRNSIRRKNVRGYSDDITRGLADYTVRHASHITHLKYDHLMNGVISDAQDKLRELGRQNNTNYRHEMQILNSLRDRTAYQESASNSSWMAQKLASMSTIWFMSSPSAYLVQISQLAAVVAPAYFAKYGASGAARSMHEAGVLSLKSDFDLDKLSDEYLIANNPLVYQVANMFHDRVTPEDHKNGRFTNKKVGEYKFHSRDIEARIRQLGLTDTQIKQVVIKQATRDNLIDISLAAEMVREAGDTGSVGLTSLSASFMKAGEAYSRKVAMLAAFEQELGRPDPRRNGRPQGIFDAYMAASRMVHDTVFNYARENKPTFLTKSDIVRVATQFQFYRLNMVSRMAMQAYKGFAPGYLAGATPAQIQERMAERKQAQREFIWATGMSLALAGAVGTPAAGLAFALVDAIRKMIGDDEDEPFVDSEQMFKNQMGDVASYGLPALFGVNAAYRVGPRGAIPGLGQGAPEYLRGDQWIAWHALNLLGPSYQVAASLNKGYEAWEQGDTMAAMKEMTPKGIRDILRAFEQTDGIKDNRGRLISKDTLNPVEIIGMAVGFNPLTYADAVDKQIAMAKLNTRTGRYTGDLAKAWAKAYYEGDTEAAEKKYIQLMAFAKAHPEFSGSIGSQMTSAYKELYKGDYLWPSKKDYIAAEALGYDTYK